MRHQFAAVHELARIEMLAGLPGETLTVLAARMRRETLAPGESIPEAQMRGLAGSAIVEIVRSEWIGSDALNVG